MITLGLIVHWATIPLIVMWPILALQYYRLAQREEKEMGEKFGDVYVEYRKRVPMFIPRLTSKFKKLGSGSRLFFWLSYTEKMLIASN